MMCCSKYDCECLSIQDQFNIFGQSQQTRLSVKLTYLVKFCAGTNSFFKCCNW